LDLSIIKGLFSSTASVVLVFVFLGVSIFVHELGHFLAARWRGLKVDRFSIGFGPRLFGWKGKGGTDYRISLLPLGGYVALPQLADMEGIEGKASEPKEALPTPSFTDKVCVLLAGATFNFLFAIVVACVLWQVGQPVAPETQTNVVGYVAAEMSPEGDARAVPSPAFEAGILPGDKILKIDGVNVSRFDEITNTIMTGTGRAPDGRPQAVFTIERDGKIFDTDVFPVLVRINAVSGDRVRKVGISPAQELVVGRVLEKSPAQAAGLLPGDEILKLDGKPLYGLQGILEKTREGAAVSLTIKRGDELIEKTVTPQEVPVTLPMLQTYLSKDATQSAFSLFALENGRALALFSIDDEALLSQVDLENAVLLESVSGQKVSTPEQYLAALAAAKGSAVKLEILTTDGSVGLTLPADARAELQPHTLWTIGVEFARSLKIVHRTPFEQVADVVNITWRTLSSLVSPSSDVGVSMLSGPVGILRVYHQLLDVDLRLVLWFTVLLNINLAILNLLPLPVLDGGHIVFALFEKLRGRPIPQRVLGTVNGVFMLLLLGMILYVTFFDSRRWQGDSRLENITLERARHYVSPSFGQEETTQK